MTDVAEVKATGAATALPSGTVTFLFTDIEGSTRMVKELGSAYEPVLDEHRRSSRTWRPGAAVRGDASARRGPPAGGRDAARPRRAPSQGPVAFRATDAVGDRRPPERLPTAPNPGHHAQ